MKGILAGLLCASVVSGTILPTDSLAQDRKGRGEEGDDGLIRVQQGDDFYCRERNLGQWFYCDKPKEKADPDAPAKAQPNVPAATRLKAISAQLEELKARAILEPTTQNVQAYIAFQREQLDRASDFADVWRRAIWQNPELDYTLERPINTLGKKTWSTQRFAQRDAALAAINQRYGVFYFYSSGCAACEVFSPIIKGVSDRFGMTIMAVSIDGGPNAAFPNFLVDTGQFKAMGLAGKQVPALVLFDTVTKQPMPIGYGVMAADEVMDRIFTLTNIEPGSDF
jgi:conjugal transfer pilus assembly protein TraF